MDWLMSRHKVAVSLLALVVGCLISSFSFNIAELEKVLALRLISLAWIQIVFFLFVLIGLFPCLYFALKYGLKRSLIAAACCVLLSSIIYILTSVNVQAILLSRFLDGMTMALFVAIAYYYVPLKKDFVVYLMMGAAGVLIGPYCSHYLVDRNPLFSVSTFIFVLTPIIILCLCAAGINPVKIQDVKPLNRVAKKTVLLSLMVLSTALLSIYYSESFWINSYTILCIAIFVTSLIAFVLDIRKDNHTGLVLLGLKGQVSVMVALNIVFIASLLSFWSTLIPIYLAQVFHLSQAKTIAITITLHTINFVSAFAFYLYRNWSFNLAQYVCSYLGIIAAGGLILFFGVKLTAALILLFCLVLGVSMGLIVISYLDVMNSTQMNASQMMFQLVFYFCLSMLVGYLPLIHYFFDMEVSFNANYLSQYQILLPESMASPEVENYLLLSNKSEVINLLKQYTNNNIDILKQGILLSFNYALNQIVYVFMITAALIMSFSAYVLKKYSLVK